MSREPVFHISILGHLQGRLTQLRIFSFPLNTELVSHLAKPSPTKHVSRHFLWQLLKHVQMCGYNGNHIVQQCTAILDSWGLVESKEVNDGKLKEYRVNYTSEQLNKGLRDKYKTLTVEASISYGVGGQVGPCGIQDLITHLLTHLLEDQDVEEKSVGVPMLQKCYGHFEAVFGL